MGDREEVLRGVKSCLAVALDLPEDGVAEDATIIGDLGADSLDLLDLTFQLEQRFGIRISPREIERRARERLGGAPLEIDGVYTPEALVELRRALPEVPPEELAEGLTQADLPRRLRVASMVNLVCRLREEQCAGAPEGESDG
jgi:acyl carrier protein